ncbi:energy transducer TonB [Polluticoccus soli]|uniref:energy transducer TonB n=1 Tax=Polluticoccus soli TaxID=3034150 RepID=UPI0023E1A286|nr:energy transducer TonB [Flavipsychrobacter sp. JY13-12]
MRILLTLLLVAFSAMAHAQTNVTLTQDTTVKLETKTFFDTVQTQPAFKGNLGQYLSKSLKIPAGTKFPPRIDTQLWIDSTGRIAHVEIMDNNTTRKPNTPLEKEIVRVIKAMPRWEPGTYNGRKVTVKYSLPLVF